MSFHDEVRGNEKVFIIDDVEINRLILEEIISSMGCHPVLAESAEEALKLLEESPPQLILTDISMPGMSGYDLCKAVKGNAKTRSIPVIFISAYDNPKDIVEGLSLGGEDYITKPFIPEIVQARVGTHLRLYETNQELTQTNRRLQISVNEQLRQMEQEKKNMLYAMTKLVSKNAMFNQVYLKRIARNCKILAQGMQLSPQFEDKISDTYIDTIGIAAPLCDIGKTAVSIDILQKKDGLTQEEEIALRLHTTLGAELLKDFYVGNDYNDFISMTVDIARAHHENWNGSGYPDGLSGADIPISAQIVAIVDRYCELTEEGGCSREDALMIMGKESGVNYNPDIYKICSKISRQLC